MARPAAVVPDSFRSNPKLNQYFARVEPRVIRFITGKARKWSDRIPDHDLDDLVQEGRCALLAALPGYDESRPLHVFMGRVLDNCYNNLLRDALAQKRAPHVWQLDDETGEWTRIPSPTVPVDPSTISETANGTSTLSEADLDHRRRVDTIKSRLYESLTPFERRVLDCYLDPPEGLGETTRNLSGQHRPNSRHLALFLKVPKTRVENAVKRIRAEGVRIATRVAEEGA